MLEDFNERHSGYRTTHAVVGEDDTRRTVLLRKRNVVDASQALDKNWQAWGDLLDPGDVAPAEVGWRMR